MLQKFIKIFESYLVLKVLQQTDKHESGLYDALLGTYTILLASERGYQEWIRRMKDLGNIYMQPLLVDISAQPELQIAILQQADDFTQTVLLTSESRYPLMRLPSIASNVCMGRSVYMVKNTRRFRRQHTL